jgi:hypothetical protein
MPGTSGPGLSGLNPWGGLSSPPLRQARKPAPHTLPPNFLRRTVPGTRGPGLSGLNPLRGATPQACLQVPGTCVENGGALNDFPIRDVVRDGVIRFTFLRRERPFENPLGRPPRSREQLANGEITASADVLTDIIACQRPRRSKIRTFKYALRRERLTPESGGS